MQRCAKVFLVLLAALIFATPAVAMNINANTTGDALIYPLYVALDGGWETKLTVINTSERLSTVAKLVVRSWRNSQELLDFLLYLSPADVWTGTLKYDPALGRVVMESTDDSCLVEIGVFASPSRPLYKELASTTDSADNGFLGYVYVINAATNPTVTGPSLVAKSAIFNWYHGLVASPTYPALPPAVHPQNILTGYADIAWMGTGASFALKPVAVMNYNNLVWIDAGIDTILAKRNQSSIGLVRLEDLLAKRTVRLPYYNNEAKGHSFHFFTFPTKIAGITDRQGFWWDIGTDQFNATDDTARTCINASVKIFDTTERYSVFSPSPVLPMCSEIFWVEALPSIIPFAEGWLNYSFNPVSAFYDWQSRMAALPNSPAILLRNHYPPVIPFVVNVGPNGIFSLQTTWEGGDFNRYSYYDFKPGVDVPGLRPENSGMPWCDEYPDLLWCTARPDLAWVGWYQEPGLEVTPY